MYTVKSCCSKIAKIEETSLLPCSATFQLTGYFVIAQEFKLPIRSIWRPEVDPKPKIENEFDETLSFVHMVHFTIEENIVFLVIFETGFYFNPERVNLVYEKLFSSCENPKCIPGNDQRKHLIEEE